MRHTLLLGILALLASAATTLATSMTSWGIFSEADFRPQIVENDLRVIVAALKLPDEETRMVRDLHTAHIGRVRDEGAAVKSACLDLIERTQMLGDGTNLKEVLEKRDAWQKRREALDKEFLDELRLILSAEQEARWSIVERELRRMRAMPDGRMLGESIDAVVFVTDDATDPTPEIADILERYARDIDAALRTRDATVEDAKSKNLESLVASDPAECARLFERIRADRIRVRDLNRKAIEDVAARLDPEAGARLRKRLIDAMTAPMGLDKSFALQILTAAADLESLTESQRAAISSATDAYIATRDRWIERYLETAMKIEDTAVPPMLERALRGETAEEPRGYGMTESVSERSRLDPLRKAWEERIDFEKRTRDSAIALLTPEQRIALPLMIDQVAIRFGDLYGTENYFGP
jgi:hypothetical protein